MCLHGYQRNTVDVDMLVRRQDPRYWPSSRTRAIFWQPEQAEFKSASGIAVQFLYAGDRAGSDSEIALPDPGDLR